jgi:hypothetical protein
MGAVFGWYARERHARRLIDRLIINHHQELKSTKPLEDTVIHVVIEKHNGFFYVWGKNKHDFMAQGSTRKELEENLAKRYPDKLFAATTENLKVFE